MERIINKMEITKVRHSIDLLFFFYLFIFLCLARPVSLPLGPAPLESPDADFFTKQTKLQIEARMALAQAKDMAHMQMEVSYLLFLYS